MSEELEDEFYQGGDAEEGCDQSRNQDSLDNQHQNGEDEDEEDVNMNLAINEDEEDVNMNLAINEDEEDVNMNLAIHEAEEENLNIPAPNQGEGEGRSKKHQKSKAQKREDREKLKEEKRKKFRKALDELREGKWKSVAGCAKAHGLAARTLLKLHTTGQDYKGAGRTLTVFTEDEEKKIATYIKHQCKYGFGLSYFELQRTIQELAEGLSAANPTRKFPETWSTFLPDKWFVYNFATRHHLTLRSTMELNKARSIVTREDLELWQSDTEGGLVFHPEFADCWKDPRRIFNQVK